jgi:hypothetical protein
VVAILAIPLLLSHKHEGGVSQRKTSAIGENS